MTGDCSKTTSNIPSLPMKVDTAFLRSLKGVLKLAEMGTMFVACVCFAVASRPKYIAATCMEFVITFSLLLLYTLKLNKKLTLFFWPLVDLFNSLFAAVFILILSLIAVSTYTVTRDPGWRGEIKTNVFLVDLLFGGLIELGFWVKPHLTHHPVNNELPGGNTILMNISTNIVGFIATGLWCVDGCMLFKRVTFNQPRTAATGTVK